MRLLTTLVLLVCMTVPAMAEKIALVIGMGSYLYVPGLRNTVNDARNVGARLEQVGFKVTYVIDAKQSELLDIMDTFRFASETADVALIYYAGHGVEASGENFMIPIDAQVSTIEDVARVSISLDQLLQTVDRARKMRIVILDACRNNPFGQLLSGSDKAKVSQPQGLAAVNPEQGTLVAFAAKEGQVALDGKGVDSPFALALMDAFVQPDLEIGLMFRRVRDDVLKATENRQEPYTYGSLSGTPFYLGGASGGAGAETDQPADPRVAWAKIRPDNEQQMRALAEQGDTRSMIGLAYIAQNPDDSRYDPKLAFDYLSRAAKAGEAEAEFELAKVYEKGVGVAPDPARALELYTASADQGYADALNDLGFLYFQGGLGLQPDQPKGIEYFQKAAALRHPEAMFNMAGMIDGGFIKDKGPKDAAAYLYDSLRAGSKDVLEQLTTNADAFSVKTRVELQKILKENNFLDGKTDGKFGPTVISALRKAYGLTG